jgi:hypothetical protein
VETELALGEGLLQSVDELAAKDSGQDWKEAARLEKLTTDFLAYARPRGPTKMPASIAETLA